MQRSGPVPVESIDRALQVLQTVAESGPRGTSLTSLCQVLGVNKSTAYRALFTLQGREFVVQDSELNYRLGPAAVGLSHGYLGPGSLTQLLGPALLSLSLKLDELVHLGVLSGNQVLYIEKVEPQKAIRVWSQVGRTAAAATTSLGRALLAYRQFPEKHLDVFTDSDAATAKLMAAIELTRSNGYAMEVEENEPGVTCVGVPVLLNGFAAAAMSITMLSNTIDDERVREVIRVLAETVPSRLPEEFRLPDELLRTLRAND